MVVVVLISSFSACHKPAGKLGSLEHTSDDRLCYAPSTFEALTRRKEKGLGQ